MLVRSLPGTAGRCWHLVGERAALPGVAGEIEILEVKMAGKRRMSAADFLNGYTIKTPTLS